MELVDSNDEGAEPPTAGPSGLGCLVHIDEKRYLRWMFRKRRPLASQILAGEARDEE